MEERLSLADLEAHASDFDDCVDRQTGIDRFCSRSEWILPYQRAFLPDRELFIYQRGSSSTGAEPSFVALAARRHPELGLYLEAIENMWCFACPLIGPASVELLDAAIRDVGAMQDPEKPGVAMALSGVPDSREPGSLLARLARGLDGRYRLHAVDETQRFVACLEGGLDGWLAARSRSFRKGLRAALRKAKDEALVFEHLEIATAAAARDLYPRILDIESRSWKSATGNGADSGHMRLFYEDMLPRVAARGGLRVLLVSRGGEDLGYLHGALTGDHFRGLQLSYDARFVHLSLGNLLQREMIERLCAEGAHSYDLGTRSDYKRRWAEEGLRTLTLVARPR